MLNKLREIHSFVRPTGYFPLDYEPYIFMEPKNRDDKRLMARVLKPIHESFAQIENDFYNDLFDSSKDYHKIYTEYLGKYLILCEKYAKAKMVKMDNYYFVKMYKPLE